MKKLGSLNKNPFRSIPIIDIVKCRALGRPFLLVGIYFFFSNFHLDAIFGKEYLNFCTSLRLIKCIFPTGQTLLFSVECKESRIRNLLMIDDSREQKHLVLYQIKEVLNASRLGLRQDRTQFGEKCNIVGQKLVHFKRVQYCAGWMCWMFFVRYLTAYDEPILNYYERNAVTQKSDHISAAT